MLKKQYSKFNEKNRRQTNEQIANHHTQLFSKNEKPNERNKEYIEKKTYDQWICSRIPAQI